MRDTGTAPATLQALPASVQVLTSSVLFARMAALMSGVPGVVLAFKAQCERDSGEPHNTALLTHRAVQHGNKRVVLALHLITSNIHYEKPMDSPFDTIMGDALAFCARQQLDMAFLEWLNAQLTDPDERDIAWPALVTVIKRGDLALMQWMHERDIGFLPDVMDVAASLGRLDIVRFLHTHRSEGCSKMAMSDAVAKGRLEVVKFLHAHRTEGCGATAVILAAQHGHDDVVAFLCEHRPMAEPVRKRLLETAKREELTHLAQCLERIEALPVETPRYTY